MKTAARRTLLTLGASALAYGVLSLRGLGLPRAEAASKEVFEVTHSDEEWKKLLDANQYAVLRHEGAQVGIAGHLLEQSEHAQGLAFHCFLPDALKHRHREEDREEGEHEGLAASARHGQNWK